MQPARSPDSAIAVVILILFAIAGVALFVRWRRVHSDGIGSTVSPISVAPPSVITETPTRAAVETAEMPRCYCDAPATRATSRTVAKVSTTGEWLSAIGFPTTYEQKIQEGPLELCDVHGRTWDAKLRRKRTEVIATERAKGEEAIAIAMATFESETLAEEVRASLTEKQAKAARARAAGGRGATPMRLVTRTGTDDAAAETKSDL
jgi:hypothetical protein